MMARLTMSRGCQIQQGRRVFLHKALALGVAQNSAFSPDALGNQDSHLVDTGGVELEKFHVHQGNPGPGHQGGPVASVRQGVGGGLEHPAETAGGEQYRLGAEDMNFPGL
jgi:hypothetical protein